MICLLTLRKVDDVVSDIVDVKESVSGVENDLEVLTDEVTTVKDSVDVLDTGFNELNDNFVELTEDLDEIIGHDNSTDSELDELKDQVADLANDLNNLDDLGPDFKATLLLHALFYLDEQSSVLKSAEVHEIDSELSYLSMTFENASFDASEWRYDTELRLEAIEASLGQTTTQPDVEPTEPPTDCP